MGKDGSHVLADSVCSSPSGGVIIIEENGSLLSRFRYTLELKPWSAQSSKTSTYSVSLERSLPIVRPRDPPPQCDPPPLGADPPCCVVSPTARRRPGARSHSLTHSCGYIQRSVKPRQSASAQSTAIASPSVPLLLPLIGVSHHVHDH
jgi:hypothetical protein